MKALVNYADLDRIYNSLEKNATTIEYTNNSHGFCFADYSYAFVYFGYTYTSITIYSANHDITAYFWAEHK